jgi:hypothetical protein
MYAKDVKYASRDAIDSAIKWLDAVESKFF